MATPTRACSVALALALVTLLFLEACNAAAGIRTVQERREARSLLRRLNKPPLATIQSPDGDIIDCVHITNQPAFDHPFLNDHTIQMRPSYIPRGPYQDSNVAPRPFTQTWQQNGKCPENTIPIRRIKEEDVLRASDIRRFGKKSPGSMPYKGVLSGHQYGVAYAMGDEKYYGTQATFDLWQPKVETAEDFSLTQLWMFSGSYENNDLNTIEVGWQVYPLMYGDNSTRLFIYWTDTGTCNWWLLVGSYFLGYWPSSLFTYLADSASTVEWGGEVYGPPDAGQSSTQMGSGHFPAEGYGKASYIKDIQVVDSTNHLKVPSGVGLIAGQPNCYNVQNGANNYWGTYIYYGGPGRNPNCQNSVTREEYPLPEAI